jgi:hypothetical protein
MSTITVEKATGEAFAHIPLFPIPASTFHSSTCRILLHTGAVMSEVSPRGENISMKENSDSVPKRTTEEEVEWDNIINTPHVREGLRRLAREARRRFSVRETEEGGFAVE